MPGFGPAPGISLLPPESDPGSADAPAQFDEPAGISIAGDVLYVADTNNHLIRTVDLKNENRVGTLKIDGLAPPPKAGAAAK